MGLEDGGKRSEAKERTQARAFFSLFSVIGATGAPSDMVGIVAMTLGRTGSAGA